MEELNTKEFVCTVCPNSCRLTVEKSKDEILVNGNGCQSGVRYGVKEYTNPERMLTTTVVIKNGLLPRLPVISTGEIPKSKMSECLSELYKVTVAAPVKCDDIILKNIAGTGIDIISSRTMNAK